MTLTGNWRLHLRMAALMLFLGVLYTSFGIVLGMYMSKSIGILLVMGLLAGSQYAFAKKIALKSMDATVVSQDEYPELHAKVNRLSQQADLPKPDVAVSHTKVPNAFAAGRSKNDSVVCVTEGLLNTLDGEEIDAVLAHELSHIKNRDVAIMTIASFLSGVAFMIVRWGIYFDSRENKGIMVAILASMVVWVLSFVGIRILSQYREYAADRGAAEITGKPSALASALVSISGGVEDIPKKDLREEYSSGMKALCIFEVDSSKLTKILSTHPPSEKRIEQLRELEKELN